VCVCFFSFPLCVFFLYKNSCLFYFFLSLGECPLDPRGYFVIKGTEKVIFPFSKLDTITKLNELIFIFKYNIIFYILPINSR